MKTVVVTGVSRGLGAAIAARLLDEGYRVHGLSRSDGGEIGRLLAAHPAGFSHERLDLADLAAVAETARGIAKARGPIYGLVNNAGIGATGVLATMHVRDIETAIATNLVGPIVFTKYLMRTMMARREGRIVTIGSITGSTGFHGMSVYAATKAGIEGFTRALSREGGKRGITVNCVAPGFLETAMTAGFPEDGLAAVRRRAPLGLPGLDQVAGAVAYLLSPDAATTTGTVMTIDGGSTA